MSDLIERLTKYCSGQVELGREAAAELERLAKENDGLRSERSQLLEDAMYAQGVVDRLGKQVADLIADNAALRADAERLDWLQANDDDWPFMNLNGEWVYVYIAGPEGGDKGVGASAFQPCCVCESHHSSLRAAIDSARAKESGDG